MSESLQRQKNTVSAENQVKDKLKHEGGKGIRILFVGNSITRHEECNSIGWLRDCGMAASSVDKDYVHILEKRVLERFPEAAFLVGNFAEWERHFYEKDVWEQYRSAIDFKADIVIVRLSENVIEKDVLTHDFVKSYNALIDTFNAGGTKFIVTTGFWKSARVDEGIRLVAKQRDLPLVELGFLGEMEEMKAIGLFEHAGVANHPGDLGMRAIAEAIWTPLSQILEEKA